MLLLCDDSALRLAYEQLSFSRYAYDGEDQCLSPLPTMGISQKKHKEKNSSGDRIDAECRWSKEAAQEQR